MPQAVGNTAHFLFYFFHFYYMHLNCSHLAKALHHVDLDKKCNRTWIPNLPNMNALNEKCNGEEKRQNTCDKYLRMALTVKSNSYSYQSSGQVLERPHAGDFLIAITWQIILARKSESALPNLSTLSSDLLSLQMTPCWQNDRWDVEDFWPRRASKGELVRLRKKPGHDQSFFHPPLLYFWRTYWHERRECVGKVTAAPGVWRGTKWKNNEWKLCSLPQPWHPNPSPSPSRLFSFLAPASRVFHPLLHPSYCFFFSFGRRPSLSFSPPPSPLPVCSQVSRFSFFVRCSSSPIAIVDASLSLSPFSSCFFGHSPISPIGLVAV